MQRLIDGVAAGKFDVAVAALTVTAGRERILDFTEPFYATGLGIAVPVGGEASWLPVIRTMTSFGLLKRSWPWLAWQWSSDSCLAH